MGIGRARADPAEDIAGAVQPGKHLAAMLLLDRVHGRHRSDEPADFRMQ